MQGTSSSTRVSSASFRKHKMNERGKENKHKVETSIAVAWGPFSLLEWECVCGTGDFHTFKAMIYIYEQNDREVKIIWVTSLSRNKAFKERNSLAGRL